MAWVACDKDGDEYIFFEKPHMDGEIWICDQDTIPLPSDSIKKLIGRDLTWDDEPVELK